MFLSFFPLSSPLQSSLSLCSFFSLSSFLLSFSSLYAYFCLRSLYKRLFLSLILCRLRFLRLSLRSRLRLLFFFFFMDDGSLENCDFFFFFFQSFLHRLEIQLIDKISSLLLKNLDRERERERDKYIFPIPVPSLVTYTQRRRLDFHVFFFHPRYFNWRNLMHFPCMAIPRVFPYQDAILGSLSLRSTPFRRP